MAVTVHERNIFPSLTRKAESTCTKFHLPAGGVLVLGGTITMTLSDVATYQPLCTNTAAIITNINATGADAVLVDLPDPFYASASPQFYAIATATVISWMLVIMLFITTRTFFIGGPGGGRFLGRRNIITGGLGSAGIVGVGGRPWLQKVATLLVAISLTVTSTELFSVTHAQYVQGFQDAQAISDHIAASWSIRILSIISKTFLWLAQVQTLIRLFPRHKEKVSIKWLGFALIVLDFVFSVLQNVAIPNASDGNNDDDEVNNGHSQRKAFTEAIPALSYLFSLSLSFLYAAAVMYYSVEKRRYAFFHPKMPNICLVALLSLLAISFPIVFFVLDIANPHISNWGDYIRWVGAASASVVVWEWVERIEALERDERRHGILGHEVFDGDDMLDPTPSKEVSWPSRSGTSTRSRSRSPAHLSGGHSHPVALRGGHTSSLASQSFDPRHVPTLSDHESSNVCHSTPSTLPRPPNIRLNTTTLRSQGTESTSHNETTSLSAMPGHEKSLSPLRCQTVQGRTTSTASSSTATLSAAYPTAAAQASAGPIPAGEQIDASHTQASAPSHRARPAFRFPFALPIFSGHFSASRSSPLPMAISRAVATSSSQPTQSPGSGSGLTSTTALAEDDEDSVRPSLLGRFGMRRNFRPPIVDLPVVVVPMQPRGTVWTPPIESHAALAGQAGADEPNGE